MFLQQGQPAVTDDTIKRAKAGKSDSVKQRRGSWAPPVQTPTQYTEKSASVEADTVKMSDSKQESEPPKSQTPDKKHVKHAHDNKNSTESFKSTSGDKEQEAVVVLQKAARGMSGRATTKNLVASKQASEDLLDSLDPMLSPTENAARLLNDMLAVTCFQQTPRRAPFH
jgi:hypothetical protein